jgi:hypothetical protein
MTMVEAETFLCNCGKFAWWLAWPSSESKTRRPRRLLQKLERLSAPRKQVISAALPSTPLLKYPEYKLELYPEMPSERLTKLDKIGSEGFKDEVGGNENQFWCTTRCPNINLLSLPYTLPPSVPTPDRITSHILPPTRSTFLAWPIPLLRYYRPAKPHPPILTAAHPLDDNNNTSRPPQRCMHDRMSWNSMLWGEWG